MTDAVGRRVRMAAGLLILAEFAVFVLVATWIGLGWTILATLATSALGFALLARQGTKALAGRLRARSKAAAVSRLRFGFDRPPATRRRKSAITARSPA